MSAHASTSGFHPVRRDRLIQEYEHDSYKSRGKLHEPTGCPECGAVFHGGRWSWMAVPAGAHMELCPACHRIADRFPAGFVQLSGDFLSRHREEILHLLQHEGERERELRPLERIMATEAQEGELLVTTTGIHLARHLGDALHRAYQGVLEFHYNPDQNLLRVHWTR